MTLAKPALPKLQSTIPAQVAKRTRQRGVLSAAVWNELHDFLTLALDALGEGPDDFSPDFLRNAVMHQRLALRICHGAMERMQ